MTKKFGLKKPLGFSRIPSLFKYDKHFKNFESKELNFLEPKSSSIPNSSTHNN